MEFWLSPAGIVLGEIHARPDGAFLPTMTEYARPGLELYGMYVDDVLADEPRPLRPLSRSAGMQHVIIEPPGRLVSIAGWDEAVAALEVVAAPVGAPGGRDHPGLLVGRPARLRRGRGRLGGGS
ncbi:hypothetical protein ACFWN1_32205 [Streptomyces sp. NPDC058459]|uniref:hypothetical protein n=1 Tax=Streptomyces sp. NPDC058459 TaxID=3346508 RepID=UPI00365107AC